MRVLYLILICFAAPVAALVAWLRGIANPERRERIADRFGRPVLSVAEHSIWVHAASMGEVQAAAELVRELLARYPNRAIVMTTMTVTGAARVQSLFPKRVTHCFLPYDLPFAARAFFDRVKPDLAIIMETELWPNLLRQCRQRHIPVIVASARISPRTAHRYRRFAAVFREALGDGVTVAAQSAVDAERFRALGAVDVQVVGNLKLDIAIADAVRSAGKQWRQQVGQRFVWVAGSTHPGEEEAAIAAHRRLRQQLGNALLVIVPRRPERFDEVRALMHSSALPFVTRSSGAPVMSSTAIVLVDTMGELLNFYAAADLAFVGGTLAPVGGHNLLEPLALGIPVLCGPNLGNTREVADLLLHAEAAIQIDSAEQLADLLCTLASDQKRRESIAQRGKQVIVDNRGALKKISAMIAEKLSASARN